LYVARRRRCGLSNFEPLSRSSHRSANDFRTGGIWLDRAIRLELIGLAAAMRGFCRDFADGQKVDIQFEADTINPAPAPDVSLCLLRVLQEALHNAVKHSRVRRFDVKLACSTSELDLRVSDGGAGSIFKAR